jgi:hypothetical protein
MKLFLFKFKLFIFYCRLQYRKLLKYGKENVPRNLLLLLIGIVTSILKICNAMARGGTTTTCQPQRIRHEAIAPENQEVSPGSPQTKLQGLSESGVQT